MPDRFTRGRRMAKHWHVMAGQSFNLTGNTTQTAGDLTLDGPWTAIRMLGGYLIGPDAAPTAQDACTLGVGIGVVSADAIALGATAVPDPIGEPDYPWLYWASHDLFYVDASLEDGARRTLRVDFDIRSMRKLKPREGLVFVLEYANTAGNPAIQFCAQQTRVLVAD